MSQPERAVATALCVGAAVLGPNGAGKSTLLKVLGGLAPLAETIREVFGLILARRAIQQIGSPLLVQGGGRFRL